MQLLEANMEQYAYPAADLDEERAQHIASLRCHGILAEQADNPLLGFIVDFMVNLLSDLTVYRRLYSPPNIELWQQGLDHQRALIQALRSGDADGARAIMADHMETAWKLMRRQEVYVLSTLATNFHSYCHLLLAQPHQKSLLMIASQYSERAERYSPRKKRRTSGGGDPPIQTQTRRNRF